MAKSRNQKKLERKQRKAKIRALQYAASAARKAGKGHKEAVKRPVREHYSRAKINARIQKRQYAADDRQMKYDALSKNDKIALINSRRGESKRELDKVLKLK